MGEPNRPPRWSRDVDDAHLIEDALTEWFRTTWGEDRAKVHVEARPFSHAPEFEGHSGARTYAVDASLAFFAKTFPDEESARREYEGHRILSAVGRPLSEHLVHPMAGSAARHDGWACLWLAPELSYRNLHAYVEGVGDEFMAGERAVQFLRDFLEVQAHAWGKTRRPAPTGPGPGTLSADIGRRTSELGARLARSTPSSASWRIEGRPIPPLEPWGTRLAAAFAERPAPGLMTIHGDETPKNVLVSTRPEATARDWVLVDYSNAQTDGDWVYPVAKLLNWWEYYSVLERAKSERPVAEELARAVTATAEGVPADSPALARYRPRPADALLRAVDERAAAFASGIDDPRWRERLALARALLALSSAWRDFALAPEGGAPPHALLSLARSFAYFEQAGEKRPDV